MMRLKDICATVDSGKFPLNSSTGRQEPGNMEPHGSMTGFYKVSLGAYKKGNTLGPKRPNDDEMIINRNRASQHPSALWSLGLMLLILPAVNSTLAVDNDASFRSSVQPILKEYCYDCHGDGAKKGGVAFDDFKSNGDRVQNHELWLKALKNLRAGIMPPPKKPQPSLEQKKQVEGWIKKAVFKVDPQNLDPGRVTVRRLNRVEYRNTIRDLLGVDFDTTSEFPADDTGHGFDNIGDVLTLSPLLLEKYLAAANTIISQAVPTVAKVPPQQV